MSPAPSVFSIARAFDNPASLTPMTRDIETQTMCTQSTLLPVTANRPCAICGKPDWCSVSSDGHFCICMRVEEGSVRPTRNGGHLHRLERRQQVRTVRRCRSVIVADDEPRLEDIAELAEWYESQVRPSVLTRLAKSLGVTAKSLDLLRVGWAPEHKAWSFPMTNADSKVLGVRLRSPNGKKWSVAGSRQGLFLPDNLGYPDSIFIAEGPTDCAALIDLGLTAVGRPSCRGGFQLLKQLCRRRGVSHATIVADADEPGRTGAWALEDKLELFVETVVVITPPAGIKDARAWLHAGATADQVWTAVERAEREKGV